MIIHKQLSNTGSDYHKPRCSTVKSVLYFWAPDLGNIVKLGVFISKRKLKNITVLLCLGCTAVTHRLQKSCKTSFSYPWTHRRLNYVILLIPLFFMISFEFWFMLFGLLFIMFYIPWSIGISLSLFALVICFDGDKFVTSFCDPSLFAQSCLCGHFLCSSFPVLCLWSFVPGGFYLVQHLLSHYPWFVLCFPSQLFTGLPGVMLCFGLLSDFIILIFKGSTLRFTPVSHVWVCSPDTFSCLLT